MDSSFLILLVLFLCVIVPLATQRERTAAARRVINCRNHIRENTAMKELAKQFIGKECMIYTIASNDSNIQGVIREIGDGGMLIEKTTGEKEIINLDFITRIREYPRKKNGKKKGIVLD